MTPPDDPAHRAILAGRSDLATSVENASIRPIVAGRGSVTTDMETWTPADTKLDAGGHETWTLADTKSGHPPICFADDAVN